jgi:hypothetical protein
MKGLLEKKGGMFIYNSYINFITAEGKITMAIRITAK